jgi:hypothetical protein
VQTDEAFVWSAGKNKQRAGEKYEENRNRPEDFSV